MKEKRIVSAQKNVYTVGYLRLVSWHMYKEAHQIEKGRDLKCIASVVFSAFTLEAYLNHIGGELINYWITIERNLSPYQKLDVISSELHIYIEKGVRPFESFREIFHFRNFFAHGRTELLAEGSI